MTAHPLRWIKAVSFLYRAMSIITALLICVLLHELLSKAASELSGAPAVTSLEGAVSFSQCFETPEKDFYNEWVSWALGRGVGCLMIPTL